MPELLHSVALPWTDGASVYGGETDCPWTDGTSVYGAMSPFTPPSPPPGGSESGGLAPEPRARFPAANAYVLAHTLSAVDLRDEEPLDFTDVSMSTDEDSIVWTFRASGGSDLFDKLTTGEQPAQVEIVLDGETWAFVVDSVSRSTSFGGSQTSVVGRSITVGAGSPFQLEQNWTNEGDATASQIAAMANLLTGLEVSWQIEDWVIPNRVFSFSGTPLAVVKRIAEAVGAMVVSDRSGFIVRVLPRYSKYPNEWPVSVPDVEIAFEAIRSESYERADRPEYNGVYVSGQQSGSVGFVSLAGTSGSQLHPLVTDLLLTDEPALRQRGISILGASGEQARVTLTLPLLTGNGEPGVLDLGELVRVLDPAGTWYGLVRSVSVSARLPAVVQTVVLERHTKLLPGTFAGPEGSAPAPLTFVGPIPTLYATLGQPVSIATAGYWINGEPTQAWSLRSGALPPGLTLNAATGVISGTPTTLGTTPGVALRVVDGILNMADSNAFSVMVQAAILGASARTLAVTGSSTGVVADPSISGASSGTFTMTGSATGSTQVPISGASSGTFTMTGSATGYLVTSDPLWANVFALLSLNEATTGTTIVDTKGHSTTAPSGYSAGLPTSQASGKFDRCRQGGGTGDTTEKVAWARGTAVELDAWHTGNWCVEGHIYLGNSSGANHGYLVGTFSDLSAFSDGGFLVYKDKFQVIEDSGHFEEVAFSAVTTAAWHHFAVTMETSGTDRIYRLYIDGVLKATSTSTDYALSTTARCVGIGSGGAIATRYDELRMTMGNRRYTADFTAPSAPFPTS